MPETPDKQAFDRPARSAQRSPSWALQRDPGTSPRARCAVCLSAAASLAIFFGGHLVAAEKIYRVVEEDGNVTFTDIPPNDAGAVVEPHSIPGTNITSAVPTAPISADKTDRSDALAAYITRIAFPSSESTIPMGPGDFVVEAEISPRLDSGEQLILLLDGETVGTPQAVPRWQLTNVFRGAHRLQFVRVSETGAAQSQSSEHTVYVMRPAVSR